MKRSLLFPEELKMDDNQSEECCSTGGNRGTTASAPLDASPPPLGLSDEAAFAHFLERLVSTAQGLNSTGLNLAHATAQPGVVLFDARFLSYRMGQPEGRFCCASRRASGNGSQVLELFAGSAPGGHVPPPVMRSSPMLRFLKLQWKSGADGPLWLYHCPSIHLDSTRITPDRSGTTTIELTSEQLAQKCLHLLVMSPMYPPDARIIGRLLCE